MFFAEEDVLEYEGGMRLESILVHEFGHVVHGVGFDEALKKRWTETYEAAKAAGLWNDGRAAQRFRRVKGEVPASLFGALTKSFPKESPDLIARCLDAGDILVNGKPTTRNAEITGRDKVLIVFGGPKPCYASKNRAEYFAEGFQTWFDTNRTLDHDHNHIHTREQLKAYDKPLAALCHDIMGEPDWRFTSPRQRAGHGHLHDFNPARSPKTRLLPHIETAMYGLLRQVLERVLGSAVSQAPHGAPGRSATVEVRRGSAVGGVSIGPGRRSVDHHQNIHGRVEIRQALLACRHGIAFGLQGFPRRAVGIVRPQGAGLKLHQQAVAAKRVVVNHGTCVMTVRRAAIVLVSRKHLFPCVGLRVKMVRGVMPVDDQELSGCVVIADLLRLRRLGFERFGIRVGFEIAPSVALGIMKPRRSHLPIVGMPDAAAQFRNVFQKTAENGLGVRLRRPEGFPLFFLREKSPQRRAGVKPGGIAADPGHRVFLLGHPSVHEQQCFVRGVVRQPPPRMGDDGRPAALRDQDAVFEFDVGQVLAEIRVAARQVGCVQHHPGERGQVEFPNVVESVRHRMVGAAE